MNQAIQLNVPMPLEINGKYYREEIPSKFGLHFNAGLWHSGHVCPRDMLDHVLLVTLNKKNHSSDYSDSFDWEAGVFHWTSQNSTSPENKRGQQVINHENDKRRIHLFVRKDKLTKGKASPFIYLGTVSYLRHTGQKPMNVAFALNSESISQTTAEALK